MALPRIIFGTRNKGKLREVTFGLEGVAQVVSVGEFPAVPEPPEDGASFEQNARSKALGYAIELRKFLSSADFVLAEDAGLEVFALGGFPGVNSSRIAPTDPERIATVLEKLWEAGCFEDESRRARFVSAMSLIFDGDIIAESVGEVAGTIASRPSGAFGFGYDPIFYYAPFGCTFGECSPERKAQVSHRGKALNLIAEFLKG